MAQNLKLNIGVFTYFRLKYEKKDKIWFSFNFDLPSLGLCFKLF